MSDRVTSYQCVLRDLKERRQRDAAALARLDAAITELEQGLQDAERATGQAFEYVSRRGRRIGSTSEESDSLGILPLTENLQPGLEEEIPPSLPQQIVTYLKEIGVPQSPSEVLTALKERGIEIKSTDPYRLVYNTLWEHSRRRDGDVKKVGKKWAYNGPQRSAA